MVSLNSLESTNENGRRTFLAIAKTEGKTDQKISHHTIIPPPLPENGVRKSKNRVYFLQ